MSEETYEVPDDCRGGPNFLTNPHQFTSSSGKTSAPGAPLQRWPEGLVRFLHHGFENVALFGNDSSLPSYVAPTFQDTLYRVYLWANSWRMFLGKWTTCMTCQKYIEIFSFLHLAYFSSRCWAIFHTWCIGVCSAAQFHRMFGDRENYIWSIWSLGTRNCIFIEK